MVLIGEIFGVFLFVTLVVIAARAYAALRREAAIRQEFGQSSTLQRLVLLYPVAPLAVVFGTRFVPAFVLYLVAAVLFVGALVCASRQRRALESSGTDRVARALEATSSATLGAIVGIICVVLAGVFYTLVRFLSTHPWGA